MFWSKESSSALTQSAQIMHLFIFAAKSHTSSVASNKQSKMHTRLAYWVRTFSVKVLISNSFCMLVQVHISAVKRLRCWILLKVSVVSHVYVHRFLPSLVSMHAQPSLIMLNQLHQFLQSSTTALSGLHQWVLRRARDSRFIHCQVM